jgi:hypothetical protein
LQCEGKVMQAPASRLQAIFLSTLRDRCPHATARRDLLAWPTPFVLQD